MNIDLDLHKPQDYWMVQSFGDGNSTENLQSLFEFYRQKCSYREDSLFLEFLPKGYQDTTLSCVKDKLFDLVILAKLHLGMLITLYDDFADNPNRYNPVLLDELYKIPYAIPTIRSERLSSQEREILELGVHLGSQLIAIIKAFPQYEVLKEFFHFDLSQFYQCNRFSQLVTSMPSAANCLELSIYGPHNMGMIAAGTIDLMATVNMQFQELGAIRTTFAYGQRIGRICNMLTTYEREVREGDMTNELQIMSLENKVFSNQTMTCQIDSEPFLNGHKTLQEERENLFSKIEKLADVIVTFDVYCYMAGLRKLQGLHEQMRHKI